MIHQRKITVLHLRHSSGNGGGADTVLYDILNIAHNSENIEFLTAYLCKPQHDISALTKRVELLSIPCFRIAGGRWFDKQQFAQLSDLIQQQNIDILHCHDYKSSFYAKLLQLKFKQLKLFRTIHGWDSSVGFKRIKGRLYDCFDKFWLRYFDLVIAVSEQLYQQAQTLKLKQLILIHNGIELDLWSPRKTNNDARPFTVGFVGRLSFEKNPLDFVNVAKQVLKTQQNCRFFIAGEGPELTTLQKSIENISAIQYVGLVARENLPEFYAQLDVLLSTSLTEGLPLVLLEAGAAGIPVVATRVGGVPEVIIHQQNGLLAEARDIDSLSQHLLELIKNPDKAKAMGIKARQRVNENFSLTANWKILEKLYLDVQNN